MDETYGDMALLFKALSDANRLRILEMLSCGELCACVILEKLSITQPTLSHHMRSLCDCNLVKGRREGKWTYYSICEETVQRMRDFSEKILTASEDCPCHETTREKGCCK